MGFDRVAEIEALLSQDDARQGQLWRWYEAGRTDAEWQQARNLRTPPTNAKHTIAALTYGVVPNGPTYAKEDASVVRRWLNKKEMSIELREALTDQLRVLNQVAGSPGPAGVIQRTPTTPATRSADAQPVPGVYVYTLPLYLAHPVDAENGRFLLKVGHSTVDVFKRVSSQSRTTALPEDPILLRTYPCAESAGMEARFKEALSRVGHVRAEITRHAGTEWYPTTLEFLDGVAREMGLEIRVVSTP